jgi:hypothetical protein
MARKTVKTLRLSDAALRSIEELAILPFRQEGTRQPDGTWLIPVEPDTWERLERHRFPGESDDDLVQRILRNYRGDPLN